MAALALRRRPARPGLATAVIDECSPRMPHAHRSGGRADLQHTPMQLTHTHPSPKTK